MTTPKPPRAADGAVRIRPYREADRAAVYEICIRTADAGQDACGQYSTDDLMPDLFAGPYLHLEPELAFMLTTTESVEGGEQVVGYVLGTADTPRFVQAYRERWIPRLADKYPQPPDPPQTPEQHLLTGHYRPEHQLLPELGAYPAHLHIDLLPEFQGRGFGRALISTWLAAAAAAGARAAFLGVDPANVTALGFYRRIGFAEIETAQPGTVYLGRQTG